MFGKRKRHVYFSAGDESTKGYLVELDKTVAHRLEHGIFLDREVELIHLAAHTKLDVTRLL